MGADLHDLYSPQFYQSANRGSGSSARICAPFVMELLHPASIVDVGCGQGEWLAAFADLGISDYQGIDGEHVADRQLAIPPEHFLRLDLSRPLQLKRRFDVALSLEVAEHLPRRVAPSFVAGLAGLASSVVFSAAVPGQGGIHHVNEQWPWYWKDLFACHDYVQLDPFRHRIWKNPDVAVYYQHNLFLYVDRRVHQDLIASIGVPLKNSELTLVRTTILQELTQPGPVGRLLHRVGSRLSRLQRAVSRSVCPGADPS